MTDVPSELFSVKSEIANLKDQKAIHVDGKKKQEIRLGDATTRIRTAGRLPQLDYNQLCNTQTDARKKIVEHERHISRINSELRRWYAHEDELRAKCAVSLPLPSPASQDGITSAIVALRNQYISFAEDPTRVNSMRLMAGTFAGELTSILSRANTTI